MSCHSYRLGFIFRYVLVMRNEKTLPLSIKQYLINRNEFIQDSRLNIYIYIFFCFPKFCTDTLTTQSILINTVLINTVFMSNSFSVFLFIFNNMQGLNFSVSAYIYIYYKNKN